MNRDINFQQQPLLNYYHPPYSPGPPKCNDMNSWFCNRLFPTQHGVNPFGIQPQFATTPLLPNPYPNPPSTKTSVLSPVPARPTDRQFVPKAVYEAVLDKHRMYIGQIKHLWGNIKDLQGPHSEFKTKLSRSKERIKSLELQHTNATAEAKRWKEDSSIKEIKCEKLVLRYKELRYKMNKLQEEVPIFKAKLKAEEDTSQKLSCKVRTLQKTVQQLKKTLACHTSANVGKLQQSTKDSQFQPTQKRK